MNRASRSGVVRLLGELLRLAPWLVFGAAPLVLLLGLGLAALPAEIDRVASLRVGLLFLKSAGLALASTLLALLLGGLALICLEGPPFPHRLRGPLVLIALLGLFLPPYYQVTLWRPAFGDLPVQLAGWRSPIFIALMGLAHAPLAHVFLRLGLRRLSRRAVDAGRLLCHGRLDFYRRILAPGLGGAFLAAGSLIALLVLLNYEVGALLLMRLYPEAIFIDSTTHADPGRAMVFALPLLLLAVALLGIFWRQLRRLPPSPRTDGLADLPRFRPRPLLSALVLAGGVLYVLVVVVGPLLRLVDLAGGLDLPQTLKEVWTLHGDGALRGLGVSLLSTLAALLLAFLMVDRRGLGARIAPWIVLPLAVPGQLIGMALIRIYNDLPPPLDEIYASEAILVIGALARFFPVAYLALALSLQGLPARLWESAELLEPRTPWRWLRVKLPLALPGLALAGGLFLLLESLDLSARHLIAPPGHQPVAVTIYSLLHYNTVLEIPAGLCLIQFGITLLVGGGLLGLSRLLAARLHPCRSSRPA